MRKLSVVLIVTIFFGLSCQKETGPYSIKGIIYFDNGRIAQNSGVFLNSELKTHTNSQGEFEIHNIDAGDYRLKVTSSDGSGYSENEIEIEVSHDITLDELLLPVPVSLLDPSDITSKSLKLSWNKCSASDFREYKIYLHFSSALDESTGTLLHISTDRNDTVFEVNAGDHWWGGSTITPNTTYFFRVFVMNEFGRMSGSNIVEAKTSIWDNPEEFTSNYAIHLESSFAAQGNLTGIDWDGNHFWMLFLIEQGGFYDNNKLTLIKYDHSQGLNLDTIIFDDSNYFSNGIARAGSNVWMSLGSYLQEVDVETNTFGKNYAAGDNTVDLAWNNENLILLDSWNKVRILNPINGSIINTFTSPLVDIGYSGEKGVAARENEIWIINNWHSEIVICDNTGKHIGVADVDFLQEGFTANYHRIPMCFMGDKLIVALDSEVRIYNVEKNN